jgi:hypothetical protein
MTIKFEFELQNLAIQGEPASSKAFEARLRPEGTAVYYLKPTDPNQEPSIQMSYSFEFE